MVYNPCLPIDIVFNGVEDLVDFAALGRQPFTPLQTIAKAYIILNHTCRFNLPLTECNKKPDTTKTWEDFKNHFRTAHNQFWETMDVTLYESELEWNNANLVHQLVTGVLVH